MLVLFDIDMTLLQSQGLGVRSMQAACLDLYGRPFSFDGIEIGGRLDPLIWRDVAAANGVADPDAEHDAFRARYTETLRVAIGGGADVMMLPGAEDLVQTLRVVEGVTLGLLTGNYEETGRMKVEAAGLDTAWFPIGAWGNDGAARTDLPPVALTAYESLIGQPVDPGTVVIIGDTEHDVECARVNGCRSLAVATGHTTRPDLEAVGADRAVDDLTRTEDLAAWILGQHGA